MSRSQPLIQAIRLAVACLVLAIGIRTWLVMGLIEPVTVAGSSMAPTLEPGDRILVNRSAYIWRTPSRWEIVVAYLPANGNEQHSNSQLCIKRVVGLPSETVSIEAGQLLINGNPISRANDPPHTAPKLPDSLPWQKPSWRLGTDEYFLLGDNSSVSLDSRLWGPVPGRLLVGKLLLGGR